MREPSVCPVMIHLRKGTVEIFCTKTLKDTLFMRSLGSLYPPSLCDDDDDDDLSPAENPPSLVFMNHLLFLMLCVSLCSPVTESVGHEEGRIRKSARVEASELEESEGTVLKGRRCGGTQTEGEKSKTKEKEKKAFSGATGDLKDENKVDLTDCSLAH